MSRTIEEQLSAVLDGELDVDEEELLLRRLERDESRRATLFRYSLIGECMRGVAPAPAAFEIRERVAQALEGEPAFVGTRGASPALFRASRGLIGAGIAAAVAVVAVISLDRGDIATGLQKQQTVASVEADAGMSGAAPGYTVPRPGRRVSVIAPARLTNYLVSHGEYSHALSRQVMDSHIVNRTPDHGLRRLSSEEPAYD